jgi:hypothetical protein
VFNGWVKAFLFFTPLVNLMAVIAYTIHARVHIYLVPTFGTERIKRIVALDEVHAE